MKGNNSARDLTKSRSLVKRFENVIAQCGHLTYFPLVVDRYEGATITDIDGNEYIDLLSSAASMDLGGGYPDTTAAVKAQAEKVTQYSMAYTYNVPAVEFAERLISVYPGGVKAKVAFGNCGSDANDAAIKFARAFTGRSKIISFINGYSGNTYGASSISNVTTRMTKRMGPFLPETYAFPYSDCVRCMFGRNSADCDAECLRPMELALSRYIDPEEVAAIIIEPIQGDSGVIPAHPKFINKLYDMCREHGILFIAEEVQQGFGRTGKFFSIEHYGLVPDGIIMGKSLGGGFPMSAFMARDEIMDCLPEVAHAFTLAGNHMAATAGIAAFDKITSPGFMDEITRKGELLKSGFAKLRNKYGIISDIRGKGLSIGVEISKEGDPGRPDPDGTSKMCFRAFEKGLVMISLAGNVFRVQPPFVISDDEIGKALAIIDDVMGEYVSGSIPDEILDQCKGW